MNLEKLNEFFFYGQRLNSDTHKFSFLEKTLIILFYMLPISLVSGSFLSDLSVSLMAILFLIISFQKKDFSYFKNYFFLFFIIFYLYLLTSSFLSADPFYSLESTLFYFRFGLFTLATYYILKNSTVVIKNLFLIFSFTFFFLIIDGYIQLSFGQNILGYEYNGGRLSSFFGDELILGSFISRLLPLLFALMIVIKSNSKSYLLICMGLLVLSDILIFITGERTALFNLLLGSLIIIVFIDKWKIIRLFTILISIVCMLVILVSNEKVRDRIITNTLVQTNILNTDQNKNITKDDGILIFSAQHESHYKAAIEMFKDYPLIGIGPKMFRVKCNEYDDSSYESNHGNKLACSTHPHNIYMQLLAETGIIGFGMIFGIFIFLCTLLIRHMYSKMRNKKKFLSDFQICLIAALIITLWPVIPSNNFFSNWINIIFYFPVGFFIYSYDNKNNY